MVPGYSGEWEVLGAIVTIWLFGPEMGEVECLEGLLSLSPTKVIIGRQTTGTRGWMWGTKASLKTQGGVR